MSSELRPLRLVVRLVIQDLPTQGICQNFVKKVYSVLFLEMAVTALVMIYFHKYPDSIASVQRNILFWTAMKGISLLVLFFFRRFIFLIAFCISQGFFLSAFVAYCKTNVILVSTGLTIAIFGCLSSLAFFSRDEFRVSRRAFTMAIIFITLLELTIILGNDFLPTAAAIFTACLCSVAILHKTEEMIVNSHHLQATPEAYMKPAIAIYEDLIILFLDVMYMVLLYQDKNFKFTFDF